MSKRAEIKAKRKAYERKKKVASQKDARKFAYIVIGIALLLLVLLYFLFSSQFA